MQRCSWRRLWVRHHWMPFVEPEAEAVATMDDGTTRPMTVAVYGTRCTHCPAVRVDVAECVV